MTITVETLKAKREQLIADMFALQGAIQIIDNLIAENEAPAVTLEQLKEAVGAQDAKVVKNAN